MPSTPDAGHQSGDAPTSRSGMSMTGAFVAFRNSKFRWLWFSVLASFSAMQMQGIALGILGWELSGSYAVVGVLQASFAIPMAVLSLPGGAVADRIEKRQLVVFSQSVLGLLGAATALLVQVDLITIALLFLGGVIQGALFSVNGPARMALMTETVSRDELTAAISLQNIAMNSTRVVAPAIAGLIIAFVSVEGVYYLTAVLYAFGVLAIAQVPKSTAHVGRIPRALASEISEGVRYVYRDRTLLSLVVSGFVIAFFVMPYQVMLPGYADALGRTELFGAMVTVAGLGGILGSFAVAGFSAHPRKPYIQFVIGVVCGVGLLGLGLLPSVVGPAGAFVALAVIGGASVSYMTLNQTMLMSESDPAYRGRVMSISMLTFSGMPLMALPLGILADMIGGGGAFAIEGLAAAAAIIVLALLNRTHTFGVRTAQAPRHPVGAALKDDVAAG